MGVCYNTFFFKITHKNGNESIKRSELARKNESDQNLKLRTSKKKQVAGTHSRRIRIGKPIKLCGGKMFKIRHWAGADEEMQHAQICSLRCMHTGSPNSEASASEREPMEKSIFTFCPCPGFHTITFLHFQTFISLHSDCMKLNGDLHGFARFAHSVSGVCVCVYATWRHHDAFHRFITLYCGVSIAHSLSNWGVFI